MPRPAPPQFFVDHKRGEVSELKAILRNPKVAKDPLKQREVIKKVIAYMTLGIDVSPIFSEMIMAANTKDLVQKKMVYHYLCSYAAQKSDLAILAINTLQKDTRDEDPMVRGLALRSLCALRLENLAEYVMVPIRKCLNDPSAYVRRTAVVGVAKLYMEAAQAVKDSDLVDVLYNMLKDQDSQVIANAIQALNEVLAKEGGMAINQQIINYLLNRIKEFNEWAQCTVLSLVARYVPADQDEMFNIMNLLEDRLKHSNSAVVLGTTQVFLNFTKDLPEVYKEVFNRLKPPLLTLMGGSSLELSYSILCHIKILVQRNAFVFQDSFKHFYVRFNDPTCVKRLKLDVLTMLGTEENYGDIITELSEYVTDVDTENARTAIRGIGQIAIAVEAAADDSIEQLLSFLDLNMEHLTAESCIVLKDLLRKYPERYEEVIPALQGALKTIDETEGKVAVIWVIGEYGDTINDAPYILEPLIDGFKDEASHAVRNELLTTTMKLFFKRPPELKDMLGRLLKAAIEDDSKVDVRDRALLYYRLLKLDVHEAARIVNCPKVIVDSFVESEDSDLKAQIFAEFNSLSVVYNMPSSKFTVYVPEEEEEEDEEEEEEQKGAAAEAQAEAVAVQAVPEVTQTPQATAPVPAPTGDLLDMGISDFLGVGALDSAPAAAKPSLSLQPNPVVDAGLFQAKWGSLPVGATVELQLQSAQVAPKIEGMMAAQNVLTMASGQVDQLMKFYFFAKNAQNTDQLFLVEAVFNLQNSILSATIKADGSLASEFAEHFKGILASIC